MLKPLKGIGKSLSLKITLSFLMTIILSIGLISSIAYTQSYKLLTEHLGKRSLRIAEIASKKVDIEAFKELKRIEDENTEAYQSLREDLVELRELTGTKYLYTMAKNDNGQFIYVVDGSDSEEISHLGDTEGYNKSFESAWEGNQYISAAIEKSEWGTLLSSYFPIKDKDGTVVGFVGADYDVKIEYEAFQRYKVMLITISVGLMILASLFSILLSKKINKPIQKLMASMAKIESGDLTVQSQVTSKDEIGSLSNGFNKMAKHISHLFNRVKQTSGEMTKSVHELSKSAEEISYHTNTINVNVNEIAAGMQQTAASVQQVTASSNEMVNDFKILLDKANSFEEVIKEIKNRAVGMKSHAKESSSIAQQVYKEKQTQMIQAIHEGEVVLEIKDMASMISRISEKINVIAVNSAIEAARAGNSGKGFAVVAEEIRILAKKSAQSVKSIDELIRQVQKAFNNLSEASQGMLEFIDSKVIKDYKHLVGAGVQCLEDAECVQSLISDFVNNSQGVIETMHEVNHAIESVAAAVEQTTVSLQEISLSTHQTVKETEEVVRVAETQTASVEQLNTMLSKLFK